jgi:hypothetical protein
MPTCFVRGYRLNSCVKRRSFWTIQLSRTGCCDVSRYMSLGSHRASPSGFEIKQRLDTRWDDRQVLGITKMQDPYVEPCLHSRLNRDTIEGIKLVLSMWKIKSIRASRYPERWYRLFSHVILVPKRLGIDHFQEFQRSFVLSLALHVLVYLLKSKIILSQYYATLELQIVVV